MRKRRYRKGLSSGNVLVHQEKTRSISKISKFDWIPAENVEVTSKASSKISISAKHVRRQGREIMTGGLGAA
jgi:hypothetical protein